MNKVINFIKEYHSRIAFWICLGVSAFLMICGFFQIPIGEIHSSVLVASGILWAFGALAEVPHAIAEGRAVKISKGDTTLTIGDEKDAS